MLGPLVRLAPLLAGALGVVAVHVADATVGGPRPPIGADDSSLEERWPAGWTSSPTEALELAQERDAPILVYVHDDHFACRSLERRAGADALLAAELERYVPLALDARGGFWERDLVQELEVPGTPYFAVLDALGLEGRLREPDSVDGGPSAALVPSTGALFEPVGLSIALATDPGAYVSTMNWSGTADSFGLGGFLGMLAADHARGDFFYSEEAFRKALALESRPNGPAHRLARLRDALRAHSVDGPADNEGHIERQLLVEDDDRLLFLGWSTLASVFELRALAAGSAPDGTYRGVDATRWQRRMRSATRLAWLGCPDDRVLPFGALLIERYGVDPEDLDSADRIFCRAVVRTLQKEAPDHPRVARAAEVVGAF